MRCPSTGAQSGTHGREPVETRATSNATRTVPCSVSASTVFWSTNRPRPPDDLHSLGAEHVGGALGQGPGDAVEVLVEPGHVEADAPGVAQSHLARHPDRRHPGRAGHHRLRRDAVPEMGGAADDRVLDEDHLGAEGRRRRGGGVSRRPATDHHHPNQIVPLHLRNLLHGSSADASSRTRWGTPTPIAAQRRRPDRISSSAGDARRRHGARRTPHPVWPSRPARSS